MALLLNRIKFVRYGVAPAAGRRKASAYSSQAIMPLRRARRSKQTDGTRFTLRCTRIVVHCSGTQPSLGAQQIDRKIASKRAKKERAPELGALSALHARQR
jgi:hypothetical protein